MLASSVERASQLFHIRRPNWDSESPRIVWPRTCGHTEGLEIGKQDSGRDLQKIRALDRFFLVRSLVRFDVLEAMCLIKVAKLCSIRAEKSSRAFTSSPKSMTISEYRCSIAYL